MQELFVYVVDDDFDERSLCKTDPVTHGALLPCEHQVRGGVGEGESHVYASAR